MNRSVSLTLVMIVFLMMGSGQVTPAGAAEYAVDLVPFATGLIAPTAVEHAGDDRLFVKEK